MNKPLVLGIAGFGTVASGLMRILKDNRAGILARTGRAIQVKAILVRDKTKARACPLPEDAFLTPNPADILADPTVDVVVELMGGLGTAASLIEQALLAGKHVVTANKALLAESNNRFFALAAQNKLHLAYEASVCGGIPIVQTLREGLAANKIHSLVGILNGTSNYILSEMSTRGLDFATALAQAQALGYAEADPTLDIGGGDAAHKLALLIRLAWGQSYPFDALPVRGISQVDAVDIAYAKEFGYAIKLLGQARMVDGTIEAGVSPALVHETFLLANVHGAYNAVRIEGDAVGPVFLHGKGAGDMPTGSAVMADILSIARQSLPNNTGFAHPTLPPEAKTLAADEARSPHYIRMQVVDAPGVLRDVAAVMADNRISIAQVIQKDQNSLLTPRHNPVGSSAPSVPLIILTHEAPARGIHLALATLAQSPLVHEPPVNYPVLAKA